MTVELKNVTTVLRPVRVIPPSTTYFSISLGTMCTVISNLDLFSSYRYSSECIELVCGNFG